MSTPDATPTDALSTLLALGEEYDRALTAYMASTDEASEAATEPAFRSARQRLIGDALPVLLPLLRELQERRRDGETIEAMALLMARRVIADHDEKDCTCATDYDGGFGCWYRLDDEEKAASLAKSAVRAARSPHGGTA